MYKLKTKVPDFDVVDGKFAGRKYRAGQTYEEIPPEERNKFEVLMSEAKQSQKRDSSASQDNKLSKEDGGKKK